MVHMILRGMASGMIRGFHSICRRCDIYGIYIHGLSGLYYIYNSRYLVYVTKVVIPFTIYIPTYLVDVVYMCRID